MSGGGAPQMSVDLARATGGGKDVSIAGAAELRAWRVGDDVLAAEATGLEFDTNAAGGSAAGQFTVRLDGGLAGGVWKAARATGAIRSAWTPRHFYADAPRGLVIQWDEGRYGETVFGAGALHYTPQRTAGRSAGRGRRGSGRVRAGEVSGERRRRSSATGGAWARRPSTGAPRAGCARGSMRRRRRSTSSWANAQAPMRIEDIAGTIDVRRGWRITGRLSGGEVKADEATLAGIAGRFDLGGGGGRLDGSLSDVTMRIFDPLPEEQRRYRGSEVRRARPR